MNWGELITLEYGKPVKDKEATDGKVPVYGTNGQIWNISPASAMQTPFFYFGEKRRISRGTLFGLSIFCNRYSFLCRTFDG